MLSPRGNVLENGAARFFKRLAEGVFDIPDLHARTKDLVAFIDAAAAQYGFDATKVIAVGILEWRQHRRERAALVAGALAGAVLFRPMVPFIPDEPVSLAGTRVFISARPRTTRSFPPATPERLAELLRVLGADVTLNWQPAGHALTRADVRRRTIGCEAGRETGRR